MLSVGYRNVERKIARCNVKKKGATQIRALKGSDGLENKSMKSQLLNGTNKFIVGYFAEQNQVRWCTNFEWHPKIWEAKNHEQAYVFMSERNALETAEAMLLNGVPAFVAELYESIGTPVNNFETNELEK